MGREPWPEVLVWVTPPGCVACASLLASLGLSFLVSKMGIITSVGGANEITQVSVLCETPDTCQELVTLRANIYLSPARGQPQF